MANENGLITQVNADPTTGRFLSDNAATGEINYSDPNAGNLGLVVGVTRVSADVNLVNRQLTAQNLVVLAATDPDLPADEGDVKTADITGDLSITAPQIITLKGVTVSGSVNMKGGKLIMKPADNGRRGKIVGGIDGKGNHRVVIYKSDVGGAIDFKDGISLTITEGTANNIDIKKSQEMSFKKSKTVGGIDGKNNMRVIISDSEVGGSVDVKGNTESVSFSRTKTFGSIDGKGNMRITVSDTTVGKDVELKDNTTASVTNCTITGDLVLKNNASCTSTGNAVSGENEGCQ